MYKYFTIDDFNLKGKVVGVRVDINSPIIDNKVVLNERITASAKNLAELSNLGAKVVVLAHQGRYKKDGCISLKPHAKLLSESAKKPVKFHDDIAGEKTEKKIASLKNGEVLLLENLQMFEDEINLNKKQNKVLKLQDYFNYYIYDAFSKAHRTDTSVIGFNKIPILAGRLMEKELRGLKNISDVKRPVIYNLGGAKPDDLVEIIETNLKAKKVDQILLSGVIGEVALMTQGYKLGKKEAFLKEKEFLNSYKKIKELLKKYKNKFVIPKDLALYDEETKKRVEISIEHMNNEKNQALMNKYLVQDIGTRTIKFYSNIMKNSASIYFKGPAGNFELKPFEVGSKGLIKGITSSNAFSYMGGGHSVTAIAKYAKITDFSYVSLAGGALVKFLSGHELPGLTTLEKSFKLHKKEKEDFIVVGSNTLDIEVSAPRTLAEFQLGDKVKVKDDFKTCVGGGGINVSVALSRLGASVSYLGKMSHENLNQVIDVLTKDRIKLVPSKATKRGCAKSILLDTLDKDRIILTYRGQNMFLDYKDFDAKSLTSKNIYFSSLGGKSFETMLKLATQIKKQNKESKICLNLSSYLIRHEKKIKSLVKKVDILIMNLEESQEFTKKDTISSAFKELAKMGPSLILITDGGNGAYAYDGKKEYFCKSVKPKKILDTTGAGDSYGATFFYYYVKGFGIKKSMGAAAQNASNVVAYKGAQKGLLYSDDIKF